MALIKKPAQPSFENEPVNNDTAWMETTAETTSEPVMETATPAKAAEAKVETTTAIAKAATTSVGAVNDAAAQAKAFQKEFDAMRGASSFEFGNYPVFKGSNGALIQSGGNEDNLGRWAQVRLMSWAEHFEVSPGEQGASTKDFVAYSFDGVTIDSIIGEGMKSWIGKPVADYVENLRTVEEFSAVKVRKFIDTACYLLATDSGDGPIGKVVQVTLSESSISSFSRYQQELKDTARAVAMNLPGAKMPSDPFNFFWVREVAKKGSNTWTKLQMASTLPAKL